MKNTLLFTYILVRLLTVNMKNFPTPKNPKICDPFLVTLENATPSRGTSPLASYKEVYPRDQKPVSSFDYVNAVVV